jgi:hypothetical protein
MNSPARTQMIQINDVPTGKLRDLIGAAMMVVSTTTIRLTETMMGRKRVDFGSPCALARLTAECGFSFSPSSLREDNFRALTNLSPREVADRARTTGRMPIETDRAGFP